MSALNYWERMMCIGTLALYLIYQFVLWTLQIGAMQSIFLLLIIHCLVNLSARKDRVNLILNLQYTENTLLSHFMEIYISSLFFYLCIQLIPLNSKYLVWVKLYIYISVCTFADSRFKCWLCSMEPSIFVCVLFVLFLFFNKS